MSNRNDAPIACTLTGDDYRDRLASIRQLAEDALLRHERRDLILRLTYASHAAARVREMVEKEQACCAFLDFKLNDGASETQVTVRAPEDARAAADELFDQFVGNTGKAAGCGCG